MSETFNHQTISAATSTTKIKGLTLMLDFISEKEEQQLLAFIDGQEWSTELKRRVQHCGFRYNYKARAIPESSFLGVLPNWLTFLIVRLRERNIVKIPPDQAIVNEYQPGQGIAPHVDCVPCFTDTIVSLSLGSACQMIFSKILTEKKETILLSRRSLLVLQGEARYNWRHAIAPRKSDLINGVRTPRNRRVSITFRKVTAPKAG